MWEVMRHLAQWFQELILFIHGSKVLMAVQHGQLLQTAVLIQFFLMRLQIH